MTTWRKEIKSTAGDDVIISCTLTEEQLDTPFHDGYGGHKGLPFTAWSETKVYFPVVYDGAEWVGYVYRNPCDEASEHWGGE